MEELRKSRRQEMQHFLSIYFVLGSSYAVALLSFRLTLTNRFCYPHFKPKDTEVQWNYKNLLKVYKTRKW